MSNSHSNNPPLERRTAVRSAPDRRLFVSLNGDSIGIADISSGGITLFGSDLSVGSLVQLDMHLGKDHLSTAVEILRVSDTGRSHGRFVGLSRAQAEAIQHYVQNVQVPIR